MQRKIMSALLVVVMLLTCIPLCAVSVSAEEYTEGVYTYTVTDGAATIIKYSGAGGNLVIPDVLGGYPVVAIADFVFENNSVLQSVVIPDGVVDIGAGTFYGCSYLTSVVIGDGVTYIGDSTFCDCISLSSLVIGNSVERLDYYAFEGCSSLAEVILPEGLTDLGVSAFGNCTALTSVTLPKSIADIGPNAFYNCDALIEVHYAGTNDDWLNVNFYTDGNMPLLNIMWPEAKGFLYQFIDGAITITGFTDDLSEHVVIPATIACHPVTAIGKAAFSDGFRFVSIEIPDTVTDIGEYAFRASGVREVNIPQGITTIRRGTFHGLGISSITIPDSVTTIEADAFSYSDLKSIVIPDSVTAIGANAFSDCESLETVTLSKNIETIEEYTFAGCVKLETVTLPNNIKTIEESAFSTISTLTDIYYSGTGEDRANIVVETNNDLLLNATWHYNCINPKDHYSNDVPHSVMDTDKGNGLAFRFELTASVGVKDKNKVDFTNATINYLGQTCKLVGVGSVVTNQEGITPELDNVNDNTVINVPTVHIQEADEDSCAFATRIINIPEQALERTIYMRPYYIVEVDGEQITVYGDVDSASCAYYL